MKNSFASVLVLTTFLAAMAGCESDQETKATAEAQMEKPQKRVAGGLPPASEAQKALIGQPQPEFSLPDMDDRQRHVSEWEGRVLVVNFWATWCSPCLKEIPAFNELQHKYLAQGVQFVGIALDDRQAITKFMERIPVDYPVLVGETAAIPIAKQYGNLEGILPYTVFVDRAGRIAGIARGTISADQTEMRLLDLI
jgi:peroxiredoxin